MLHGMLILFPLSSLLVRLHGVLIFKLSKLRSICTIRSLLASFDLVELGIHLDFDVLHNDWASDGKISKVFAMIRVFARILLVAAIAVVVSIIESADNRSASMNLRKL